MITQEEISYTQDEIRAMVKTIEQLRKEKKELVDKACLFLRERLVLADNKWYVNGEMTLKEKMIAEFRKEMED